MQLVECRRGAVSASGTVDEETRDIVIKIQFDHRMPAWAKGDLALFTLEQGVSKCLFWSIQDTSHIPTWLIEAIKGLPFRTARLALTINGCGSITIVVYDSPSSFGYESNEDVILRIVLAVASSLENVEIGA